VALGVAGALAVVALTAAQGAAAGDRKHLTTTVPGCAAGSIQRVGTPRMTYAARVLHPLNARRSLPGRGRSRFEARNLNGVATVFAVVAARVDRSCRPTEYEVQLPIRPNGSTGWVRSQDVRLSPVRTRLAVDLSQRRITLFRDGRPILVVSAVVGAPSTPTPTGRFYVNQRLRTGNPFGDYGPGAVGISAFSPVLLHWAQGGPIAIHGTNAPGLIGSAVSHGCLRVRNADIEKLLRLAVEGTPVQITQ
jgi:lipoprotein-anchoring transpeptidase ErfK/SrfK